MTVSSPDMNIPRQLHHPKTISTSNTGFVFNQTPSDSTDKRHLVSGNPLCMLKLCSIVYALCLHAHMLPVTPSTLVLELCRIWTATRSSSATNQISLCDDVNRIRMWRPSGERFNPTFAVQGLIALTADVMVWYAIAYDIRLPLILISNVSLQHDRLIGTFVTYFKYVLPLVAWLIGGIFQQDNAGSTQQGMLLLRNVSATLLLFLGLLDPQICHSSRMSGITWDG